MSAQSNNAKGISLILTSALMFGSYGVWSKLIGDSFGVFFQSWTRALAVSIILLPILIWKKQLIPIAKKDWKWMSIFLIFTALTQAPIYYAFTHMDIGSASVLFFVTMLLTMYVVGYAFLGEKMSKVKIISFLFAIAGLYLSFSFSIKAFSLLAALMAILNGIASGGEVAISKKLSHNYSALYITWLSWVILFITNAPISFLIGETQHLPALNLTWLYFLIFLLVGLFAFQFIIAGLKYVEASIGGLLGLLEIIFSIIFGILIFGESLEQKALIGAILVITAAALPHVVKIYQKKTTKKPA
jgi:drug/metabolite transporter (DMT)-like permease